MCDDESLAKISIETGGRQTEENVEIGEIDSIQNIEHYLNCTNCTRKIMQGTCTTVLKCDHCGFMMRSARCTPKVSARVVVLSNAQQLTLRIDEDILSKMLGVDIQTIDANTLAERLFLLENFALSYNTETCVVTKVNM